MVGVQHAKRASREGERDDNRDNEMKDKSGRVSTDGKESMRALFASPCQDADQPTSTGSCGEFCCYGVQSTTLQPK
jgi:hypothetical protein